MSATVHKLSTQTKEVSKEVASLQLNKKTFVNSTIVKNVH